MTTVVLGVGIHPALPTPEQPGARQPGARRFGAGQFGAGDFEAGLIEAVAALRADLAVGSELGVGAIATAAGTAAHPAVLALAAHLGVPVRGVPVASLVGRPAASDRDPVADAPGTAGVADTARVAEAAVLALGGEPLAAQRTMTDASGAVFSLCVGRVPDLAHHGDAETAPGLVDLAVNVRPGGPPAWLRRELAQTLGELGAYPDPRAATVAVGARHGRTADEVLLTAGAAEAFVLLARALAGPGSPTGGRPPRRVVVVHPQFTEPEAALRAAGHAVHRVLLPPPYLLDPAQVPDDADVVVIGNPTNPTSVLHPAATIAALARPGRVLLVDEAFLDAVPGEPESLTGHGLPGLVVSRSLTKTWALAGLRIGYLVGDPHVLAACRAAQPLWSVSTPALVAAEAVCRPMALAQAQAYARAVAGHRDHLVAGLSRLPGIEVVPGARAPFVLVRGPRGLHPAMRSAGWALRRADTFPGLDERYVRIAVRDPDLSDRLLRDLAQVLVRLTRSTPAPPAPLTPSITPTLEVR